MRWASVGACILGASRASKVFWTALDVAESFKPHLFSRPARDDGMRWCEQKNGGSAEARSSETRTGTGSIDPLARAASDLHLEATASLVYSPHVLNIAATRALIVHVWCLGPSPISAASKRPKRLRFLKPRAQLHNGLLRVKTPARTSRSMICIHTAAQDTYNASSCILNRCS